jgi:hypothetical protein
MKKTMSLLGIAVLTLCVPMMASAGDFHHGATLICSDCHNMHYSQTHGYNPDGSGLTTDLGLAGPYHYLLRNDVNELCLTCHDNVSFAPDVLGANSNGYVRSAGALNRPGTGEAATGHTLDATDVAPGSVPAWNEANGLHCTNCHQPHGHNSNGNAYRNLVDAPGNAPYGSVFVSYATGTNDLTTDVYQVAAGPQAVHYSYSNIFFNEPDPTKSSYGEFCKGCHNLFHGDKGGPELGGASGTEWWRHPTNDADIGAVGGGHSNLGVFTSHVNRVPVMSATGVWDPPAADNTPSCMSCHKSHGNQNSFGLVFMSGTGTVTEEGDDGATVKALCKQCHVQG